jgi:hypothetical protein
VAAHSTAYSYNHQSGTLHLPFSNPGSSPVALAEIAAAGRTYPALTQVASCCRAAAATACVPVQADVLRAVQGCLQYAVRQTRCALQYFRERVRSLRACICPVTPLDCSISSHRVGSAVYEHIQLPLTATLIANPRLHRLMHTHAGADAGCAAGSPQGRDC